MVMLGKRIGYHVEGSKICLQYEEGQACLDVINEEIVHVLASDWKDTGNSKAIEGDKHCFTEIVVKEEDNALVISTPAVTVKVFDEFYVDIYKADGQLLCADYRAGRIGTEQLLGNEASILETEGHEGAVKRSDYQVQVIKSMDGDEKFYGLGDKTGVLNKRDYEYENWNSDVYSTHTDGVRALYKSIPFLITLKDAGVYGIFFDNTYHSYINLGKECRDYYYYGAEGGCLDYYFIGGSCMKDVVSNYTYLTGRTPLPQLWTLGYHQSRVNYHSDREIREVAHKLRELQLPCDAIYFDLYYMDECRVFTWNEEEFGKPGEIFRELKENGFRSVPIVDPGVKLDEEYSVCREGIENGYFVKNPSGDEFVGVVWPEESLFPDFGNPEARKWWGEKQDYLRKLGADGIWTDMNEPANFKGEIPLETVFRDEEGASTHAAMHNVYGHLMAKAAYEGLRRFEEKRPFVITRACYAGTQKYAATWTGDNQSLWAHLQMAIPQLANLGLSGYTFAGTDIGGFTVDCTPELLCRWVQVGAFMPLFRNHSSETTRHQEPWQFDEKTLDINRKFIELRYKLLPYIYDLMKECEETGLPVIRPLVLHYEKDPNTWNLNTQFLVGENLLAAPVLEQGAVKKMVYLPEGNWYDFYTGRLYKGMQYYLVDAPLDTCPMFAKEGSMIPLWEVQQYVGEKACDILKLMVFPGKGRYVHYQDNGEDFEYKKGNYNLYEFNSDMTGNVNLTMLHKEYPLYTQIKYIYPGRSEEKNI